MLFKGGLKVSRRLEGKVAIVTGAGTGIGEAVAHKFAKEGASVIVSLPDDPIEDVAKSIEQYGSKANIYAGDVSQEFNTAYKGHRHLRTARYLGKQCWGFLATAETQDYPSKCSMTPSA